MPSVVTHELSPCAYRELGYFILPRREWRRFKRLCLRHYKALQHSQYELALDVYDQLKQESYNRRRFPYYSRCLEILRERGLGSQTARPVLDALFIGIRNGSQRLYKPAKCRFHTAPDAIRFEFAGAILELDDAEHAVRWKYTPEMYPQPGNSPHYLESVAAIFDALVRMKYVRGTGGVFISEEKVYGYGPLGQAMIGG